MDNENIFNSNAKVPDFNWYLLKMCQCIRINICLCYVGEVEKQNGNYELYKAFGRN